MGGGGECRTYIQEEEIKTWNNDSLVINLECVSTNSSDKELREVE